MSFEVPKLKFAQDALEPYLSEDNVHYHYAKHTKKYFETTNELIKGTSLNDLALERLINDGRIRKETKLYNNIHQAYNHQMYWENLAPKDESGKPSTELLELLDKQCDGFDKFKESFEEAANKGFGSYWQWLTISSDGKLIIATTQDADTPNETILLVVDFWEHAYLYDPQYVANRQGYMKGIWSVINWGVVNERFKNAK